MRHLATIRKISAIRPIPNADRIEVAQVDGWECVVKKGEFQPGDTIVYVEVDSIMPEKPEFEFLRDRKFRVKTARMRGQISQGLVLSMDCLPPGNYNVGDDVTDTLGVKKYDPQVQQESAMTKQQNTKKPKSKLGKFMYRFEWYRNLDRTVHKPATDKFPSWIKKTDEERIQNLPELFEQWRKKDACFSMTEKMDGQSATYFLRRKSLGRYEFGVCSRNIWIRKENNSSYWEIARKYNMKRVLRQLMKDVHCRAVNAIVLQGGNLRAWNPEE